jgi:hypothetical protein
MSVTIADVAERVDTDLGDDALQRILDAAETSVERSAGNANAETEQVDASNSAKLTVSRLSTSITSVTERTRHSSDAVTLSANDYRKIGNITFLRLGSGDNPASFWGKEVTVVYVPEVDLQLRDRVTLDLCMMDIELRAFDREKKGSDWEGEQKDHKARRRALLAQIREGRSQIL